MKRRDFLAALGAAGATATAGCINQLSEPDATLGDAFTVGDHTVVVKGYQTRENIARVGLQFVNVSNQRSDPRALLDGIELQVGRDLYEEDDAASEQTTPFYSSELLPGELVQTSIAFPPVTRDARTTLRLGNRRILLNDPQDDVETEPSIDLDYEATYPSFGRDLVTDNATYTFERLGFRDHLPIFGERVAVTITNTTDSPLSFSDRDIILKTGAGREVVPTSVRQNLANNPVQPDEERRIDGVILALNPDERNDVYVGIDRDHDTLGTKALREFTPR